MSYSAIRIPAKKLPANAAVIMLHGLGDTGAGWKFIADIARQSPKFDQVKFVFPNAPIIPITVNQGYQMPGWFDICDLTNIDERLDVKGFFKTCDVVKDLIKEQTDAGISPDRIVLGGFSQGAAVALASAATLDAKLAGFLVLSGFCPLNEALIPRINNINVDTPIYRAHGTADPVITFQKAIDTTKFLIDKVGFTNYTFKEFPGMGHTTCEEELGEIFQFLGNALK